MTVRLKKEKILNLGYITQLSTENFKNKNKVLEM